MQRPSHGVEAVQALPAGSTMTVPPSTLVGGVQTPARQVAPPLHWPHICPAVPQAKLFYIELGRQRPKAQQPVAHEMASQPVLTPASTGVVPVPQTPPLHWPPFGHIAHCAPPVPQVKRFC
jgi:hypothetical protein